MPAVEGLDARPRPLAADSPPGLDRRGGIVSGENGEKPRGMDGFGLGCGGPDEMALGMASSRDSSELVDSNCNIMIAKREYADEEDDFVDVNGPFLCIKHEVDEDDDDTTLISSAIDPTRIFKVRRTDHESLVPDTGVANQELLLAWEQQQSRDSSGENNRESIWMRGDHQCEVWSCKMTPTYGHSTKPSRCAQHREAWMVMFDHCMVAGCLKFGVMFSSEDDDVRCEAHDAEYRCRRSIQRPLEHLVDDSSMGPAGLGLGLGLGEDCRVHEASTMVRQPQVVVIETSLGGTGESSGHSGNAQEAQGGVAETSWAVPASNDYHPTLELNSGVSSNSVGNEIQRLKEEYDDHRQKMVKLEIELARLQALQFCEPQKNVAQGRRATQGRPRQSSEVNGVGNSSETNGASATLGKFSLDGYNWRKYGEMSLSGIGGLPHPRIFYGCTNIGCIARKIEEQTVDGHVKHFYEGVHNHPQPGKRYPRPVAVPHWKRRKRHHNSLAD